MDMNWSLDALYPGFDAPAFLGDIKSLNAHITALYAHADALSDVASLEQYMHTLEAIESVATKLYSFASLTFSVNTGSEDALKAMSTLQTKISELASPDAKLSAFLLKIENLEAFIAPSEYLKALTYVLKERQSKAQHTLSEKEEMLAAKLVITGSSSWSTLQQKLVSTLTASIEKDGKWEDRPITVVRNMAHDPDPAVRKAAYEAELKAYGKIAEASAMALNSIKGEVITLSELRGYSSPLSMTLKASRMNQKTLDAMLSSISEALPEFHRYLSVKAEALGHTSGLPFYDLFAPMGTQTKSYPYEEGCAFVVDNFRTFSDKLADTAAHAMQHKWIDVEPKTGKVSGAFCAPLHALGEFRVMLNYTGNLGDVITMAHELGHGYHAICTNSENPLNIDYPMPLAETASTFCETIVNNAILKEAQPEEALTILENMLQDCTQVICDIYSRYLFESALFETRADHPLSVDELCTLMLDAQRTAYGEGLDADVRHPYMWLIKPHYYSAGLNFYNFPYAFGLLFAKGLYAKYLDDPEFFKNTYDDLLAASGRMDIVDVCKIMNIDVEDRAFWDASLKVIIDDIHTFERLSKTGK